jgi:hypothetical protein
LWGETAFPYPGKSFSAYFQKDFMVQRKASLIDKIKPPKGGFMKLLSDFRAVKFNDFDGAAQRFRGLYQHLGNGQIRG